MFLPRTTVIEMVEMTRTEECFLVQRCFLLLLDCFCVGHGAFGHATRGEQVKELEKMHAWQFFVTFFGMFK